MGSDWPVMAMMHQLIATVPDSASDSIFLGCQGRGLRERSRSNALELAAEPRTARNRPVFRPLIATVPDSASDSIFLGCQGRGLRERSRSNALELAAEPRTARNRPVFRP